MAARYLLDTNLLVYAVDRRVPEKRERAVEVVRRAGLASSAALPAQVLAEFSSACLRKLEPRPEAEAVRAEGDRLLVAFEVLPLTGAVVLEAVRGVRDHMLSYYDAQIWAAARLGQVGAVLDGVSFLDPLDPGFDLAELE